MDFGKQEAIDRISKIFEKFDCGLYNSREKNAPNLPGIYFLVDNGILVDINHCPNLSAKLQRLRRRGYQVYFWSSELLKNRSFRRFLVALLTVIFCPQIKLLSHRYRWVKFLRYKLNNTNKTVTEKAKEEDYEDFLKDFDEEEIEVGEDDDI